MNVDIIVQSVLDETKYPISVEVASDIVRRTVAKMTLDHFPKPILYRYQLATLYQHGQYSGWVGHVESTPPNVPPGSVRYLTGLYTSENFADLYCKMSDLETQVKILEEKLKANEEPEVEPEPVPQMPSFNRFRVKTTEQLPNVSKTAF